MKTLGLESKHNLEPLCINKDEFNKFKEQNLIEIMLNGICNHFSNEIFKSTNKIVDFKEEIKNTFFILINGGKNDKLSFKSKYLGEIEFNKDSVIFKVTDFEFTYSL